MSARSPLVAVVALLAATNLACGAMPLPFSAPRPSSLRVTAEYVGAGAEDVEQAVAEPLERALLSVSGVARVDTSCRDGVALLDVRLAPGTDAYAAAMEARERMREAEGTLPTDVAPLLHVRPPVDRVTVLVSGDDPRRTSAVSTALAEAAARIAGVSEVSLVGQHVERTEIHVDGPRLLALGLTPAVVRGALERSALGAPLGAAEDLRSLPLNPEGLRLSDVASLEVSSAPLGRVYANGEPAVVLRVDVAQKTAEAELAQLVATVPEAWIMTGAQVYDVHAAEASLDEVLHGLSSERKPERGVALQPADGPAEFWSWGGALDPKPGVTLRPHGGDRQTVVLSGQDREILDQVSGALVTRLSTEPGVAFVALRSSGRTPERRVQVDRDAAARLGLSAGDVATAVADTSGQELRGSAGSAFLIVDGLGSLEAPEAMMLPVRLGDGPQMVPLSSVARVELAEERALLTRRDGRASVVVDVDLDAARLTRIVADMTLPVGVGVQVEAE